MAGTQEEGIGGGDGVALPWAEGSRLWPVHGLRQMQRRRYLLMHTGLELFVEQSTVFFNLHNRKVCPSHQPVQSHHRYSRTTHTHSSKRNLLA